MNKSLKKVLVFVLMIAMTLTSISCGKKNVSKNEVESEQKDLFNLEENIDNRKAVVVYFSVNDETKDVAEKFKEALDADIIEIVPKVEYTEEDLDFDDINSRVYLEDEFNPFDGGKVFPEDDYNPDAVPVVATEAEVVVERKKVTELPDINSIDVRKYQIIVVGFPVWYENAPKVIYTFVKDLKNKIVIPFCTGAEMGMIDQYLTNFTDESVRMMSGKEFDGSVSVEDIKDWVTILSADFDVK